MKRIQIKNACGYVHRKSLPKGNNNKKKRKKKITIIWHWKFLCIIAVENTEISLLTTLVILARKVSSN